MSRLEKDVGRLDPTRFTITPANFDKSYEYSKFSISFFGNDKTLSKTNLEFFLRIHFSDEHTFWERAKWIAEALDVLQRYGDEFKEDKMVEFHHGEMRLRVENKERYREQIVNTLYVKARRVADAIAAHENTTPAIKEMSCTQSIREEILNIHKASLSLDATILFEFTGRSIQEQNP
ncbi:MAG: hypothetical protein GY859_44040 [Desulfobacterales bacterium]|nr:hypothetical protein [Desulfobacterales bacterium]